MFLLNVTEGEMGFYKSLGKEMELEFAFKEWIDTNRKQRVEGISQNMDQNK